MKRVRRIVSRAGVVVTLLTGLAFPAHAGAISFVATDVADVAGEDRWSYEYLVSGFAFDANQGFSIYFDSLLYSNLQSLTPPGSAEWDILTFEPDPGLPSDGVYDALALVPGASLDQFFSLTFTWLGGAGTAPGAQAFTLNQFDDVGNISFIESGQTTPRDEVTTVPEPSTLLLLGPGIALMLRRRLWAMRAGHSRW